LKADQYNRVVNSGQVLTAIGPSTLIRGTLGKTTVPSGIAYTSTSEQSTPRR